MSQTLQICCSGFNRPESRTEKTKERQKADREIKFSQVGNLVSSSNKVFIKSQSIFVNRKQDVMVDMFFVEEEFLHKNIYKKNAFKDLIIKLMRGR